MEEAIYLIVMAGGIGSRFWPVSTEEKPKQFLDMLGTGRTLFQQTIDRFQNLCAPDHMIVVTAEKYTGTVKAQCPELEARNILAEPCIRNTAPCIAYASYKIWKQNKNALIVVSPADHLIADRGKFERSIRQGLEFSRSQKALLTLGIQPRRPETGYGYIQMKNKEEEITSVECFREKPDLNTAQSYLADGRFLWNSGIFIWSAETILHAFRKYAPAISAAFKGGLPFYDTPEEQNYINRIYPDCENISIDYSILEKAEKLFVQKVSFDWSDLGTWSAVWEKSAKTKAGNAVSAVKSHFYESSNNIVYVAAGKQVVIQGLNDYIIVEANDSLLICSKKEEQRIKEFLKAFTSQDPGYDH
ncbi:MAG: mannose-1-phosphate guanylyltransferase [Mangrovibacterium sp.]